MSLYLHSHFYAIGALAQLVEQWTENPCVPGSIPGGTTTETQSDKIGFFGSKPFLQSKYGFKN